MEEIVNFNDEPVYYCPHCLSLKIKIMDDTLDFCEDCGCTDIDTLSIEEWSKLYKERYNKEYLKIK